MVVYRLEERLGITNSNNNRFVSAAYDSENKWHIVVCVEDTEQVPQTIDGFIVKILEDH